MSLQLTPKGYSKKSISATGKPHPKLQFTPSEDNKLKQFVQMVGDKDWELISQMMENRNPRQCMERWNKYLSPDINRSPWTDEEDALLISKHAELGAKWVKISKFFNNRTDAALKNRWNVLLRREKTINSSSSQQSTAYESPIVSPTPAVKDNKEVEEMMKKQSLEQNVLEETNPFDFDFDSCGLLFEPDFAFSF